MMALQRNPRDSLSVLVTGASTGLGLETSLHLAQRGFPVYAAVFREEDRKIPEEQAQKRKVEVWTLQMDITDSSSIQRGVETVVRESGGIYGLVNNAGTRLRGCFEDLTDPEIRRLFDTNVFGTMSVTRAVLPYMRASRRGRVVFITSVAGRMGSFGISAYCSTKFAQEGFAESLSLEVAPWGIQVAMVEPGLIQTEAWTVNRVLAARAQDSASPYYAWFRESERLADRMVQSSAIRPEDVAKAVAKALTARRPKLRYLVGRRAKLVFALRRYFPGEWFERLFFRQVLRMITRASGS